MITSAAVKITLMNGEKKILKCHRHCDIPAILHELNIPYYKPATVEGFIKEDENDNEIFLSRAEAYIEAERCGQLIETANDRILYSEMIW